MPVRTTGRSSAGKRPASKSTSFSNRPFSQSSRQIAMIFVVVFGLISAALLYVSRAATSTLINPTPGAVNVRTFCTRCDGNGDDTAAFKAAIDAASKPVAVRYANGPTGQSQGVVYVPAGNYRLLELNFNSNIRLEVDAGAVLMQAGGQNVPQGSALIRWDGPVGSPLQNVSLVGVGASTGGLKQKVGPIANGWSVDNSFAFNLDSVDTSSNNKISGLIILNTKGFLTTNILSIQNDFLPSSPPTDPNWEPTTQKAALVTRARSDSPCGGPFAQPYDGKIINWYNVHGPKGYGPNQIGAGTNLSFSHIFTQGGTALRLETDSSQANANDVSAGRACPGNKEKFGAEIRNLVADDVEGVNCNRAVSFSPHSQDNYDVHVTNVRSTNCAQAVVVSRSPFNHLEGSFNNATVANVTVTGGNGAQNGVQGPVPGYWNIGLSLLPFSHDGGTPWEVIFSGRLQCDGSFQKPSDPIAPAPTYNGGKSFRPQCPGSVDITTPPPDDSNAVPGGSPPASGGSGTPDTSGGSGKNKKKPAPDSTLSVRLLKPVIDGEDLRLNASVTGQKIQKVTFLVDGKPYRSDYTDPYSVLVDGTRLSKGKHTIKAIVYEERGGSAQSPAIRFVKP